MSRPLFSVITIAKNAGTVIGETLRSVACQDFQDFEYLVIDGDSRDDTLSIVGDYHFPNVKVVSESDQGIADAMNKGIQLSSGKLIIHLNAGDSFADLGVLKRVAADYSKTAWQWAIGSCAIVDAQRGIVREKRLHAFDFEILRRVNFVPHQSTFVARAVFDRFGLFDKDFKITMDYDLWLRIGQHVRPSILPFVVSRISLGGVSSNELRNYFEYRRARIKNCRERGFAGLFFEASQLGWRVALFTTERLATVGAYQAIRKSTPYSRLRKWARAAHASLDTVFTISPITPADE
jgi:glycosyltransferase involved in cell wall biosynthesis